MNIVSKVWLATCTKVYEVQMFDNNTCQLVLEPGNNIAMSMRWGKTDAGKTVFSMRNMPHGVDQLTLPIIVEGGFITGNQAVAEQMAKMLGKVAIQATMAAYMHNANVNNDLLSQLNSKLVAIAGLPTPLDVEEDDEPFEAPAESERRQVDSDDSDDAD